MNVRSIWLSGRIVQLEPLSEAHVPELCQVGLDERIWRFMLYGQIEDEEDMRAWVQEMLRRWSLGADLPFVVRLLQNGQVIGATRFMEMRPEHRSLEIGGTWYGVAHQGSGANKDAKYLMLRQAFEEWNCVRVQIKTDLRNERSQQAIERLGAVREGVLRNHMILPDGYLRSSVIYSILDSEWPLVKTRLEERLGY
jgi:RimJ/RimL family protein N-acetyltransferase